MRTWSAPDHQQDQLRQYFLDHLAKRSDGWSRACLGAHLTASSLICAAPQGKVLLTLHARIGRWGEVELALAGMMDRIMLEGADPQAAAHDIALQLAHLLGAR